MRSTSAKRKLIPRTKLRAIQALRQLDVPLNTILRKQGLPISRPVVVKLLNLMDVENAEIQNSIFPAWLKDDGEPVQENPDGWTYRGFFPHGYWEQL